MAESLLIHLENQGLVLRVNQMSLIVSPSEEITESRRELIRRHKQDLIRLVQDQTFSGFLRLRGPKGRMSSWQRICQGATWGIAYNRLCRFQEREHRHRDHLVRLTSLGEP